jgi:hypothetical protein
MGAVQTGGGPPGKITLPVFELRGGGKTVKTAGLGFDLAQEVDAVARPAPALGADNQALLRAGEALARWLLPPPANARARP